MRWREPGQAADAGAAPLEAVVYLTGFEQDPPKEVPVIAQRDKTFLPELLVIVAGQSVRFTNEDDFLHNVFSTSKARPFDLGKPGPGEAREVRFSRPGVVELYCNIHESMSATLLVLPNRAFARVDARGRFRITGIPDGTWSLFAWGPRLVPYRTTVTVKDGTAVEVTLPVSPRLFQPSHLDKFGRVYRNRGYPH